MLKISTELHMLTKLVGEEKAIRMLAEAGFDCYDLSLFSMAPTDWKAKTVIKGDHPLQGDDYRAFVENLRRVADECGIECNQSHAPFPSHFEGIFEYLERAIECTAIAGGKICVIHPVNNDDAETNAELYRRLLPTAKRFGVKIATENMWNWNYETNEAAPAACSHHDDFVAHVDAVNDPYLVACVDIGHAEMRGLNTDSYTMIKALGNRVQALHLHDNDKHRDSHALPFTMDIDFDSVARALAEIDYQGEITLEPDRALDGVAIEDLPAALKKLADSARRIAEMVEAYRK